MLPITYWYNYWGREVWFFSKPVISMKSNSFGLSILGQHLVLWNLMWLGLTFFSMKSSYYQHEIKFVGRSFSGFFLWLWNLHLLANFMKKHIVHKKTVYTICLCIFLEKELWALNSSGLPNFVLLVASEWFGWSRKTPSCHVLW
jgi:hypothetical protein